MPMTIMRGMCALPAKKNIRDRYLLSRKEKLILLVVSDLDPAGDAIAADLLKSFRRDFGITNIEAYKVALTIDQVRQYDLVPSMEAKETPYLPHLRRKIRNHRCLRTRSPRA